MLPNDMRNSVAAVCLIAMVTGIAHAQSCTSYTYTTFLPDGKKCNFYTACVNQRATPLVCPSGYHFNVRKQLCDFPSEAGCIKCPAVGFANMAVDGSCKKFVQCFMGTAIDRECPPGLMYDPAYGQCNLDTRVACK
ncbi:peritrophin-44-like [Anopheles cruzii]|uniref:peritrophin-44-like n=1 Tax=Anopheles cruzii TaxID=68878 RepID=UPI0022EC8BF4|nr:peritrophin-44-like [Anopheles cruzii]